MICIIICPTENYGFASISAILTDLFYTREANVSSIPAVFLVTSYAMFGCSELLIIIAGFTKPRDLQMSFLVCLVAVAVIAIMLTDVSNNPLISPRFEYSYLNSVFTSRLNCVEAYTVKYLHVRE